MNHFQVFAKYPSAANNAEVVTTKENFRKFGLQLLNIIFSENISSFFVEDAKPFRLIYKFDVLYQNLNVTWVKSIFEQFRPNFQRKIKFWLTPPSLLMVKSQLAQQVKALSILYVYTLILYLQILGFQTFKPNVRIFLSIILSCSSQQNDNLYIRRKGLASSTKKFEHSA